MLNFVTFMECVNAPGSACLSEGFFLPIILTLLLVIAGALLARQDRQHFRALRAKGIWTSFLILVYSVIVLAYFFLFAPDAVQGVATSDIENAFWATAVLMYGIGVAILAGMAGFALGGWLVKTKRKPMPTPARLVIAIDGPAASGKGTLAKRIAAHYSLPCLDTGLLYRAVARDVAAKGGPLDDAVVAASAARSLDAGTLDDPNLRGPAAGDAASIVAKMPGVRSALLDYQRAFASQGRGAVLDGRDIGTVICPNADVKLYITATADERARRRHLEHKARGEDVSFDAVLADIRRRDERDSARDVAPLEAASDAITIDTTTLDADAAFAEALRLIASKTNA